MNNTNEYGVYGGDGIEIVVTPDFHYELFSNDEAIGVRLFYLGKPFAFCEHRRVERRTIYAFRTSTDGGNAAGNDDEAVRILENGLSPTPLMGLQLVEPINILESGTELPYADTTNVKQCLQAWRRAADITCGDDGMQFTLMTDRLEYVCSIQHYGDSVYCGASANFATGKGLVGGGQYFRLRHLGDDSMPYCGFFAQLNAGFREMCLNAVIDESNFGAEYCAVNGLNYWSVKSITPTEIILNGCDGDEYHYDRNQRAAERYEA
jgi:hypothetical protein